jgi:hypothetical protein
MPLTAAMRLRCRLCHGVHPVPGGLIAPRVRRDSCRIQVLEQAQRDTLAPLKTKASRRTIPVGEWVLADIAAHLDQFGPGPHQLVISTAYGGFLHRNAFSDLRHFMPRL